VRHGRGSDLPGMTHSQGARIGVIYVSPDDDRKTVLTAILAEEKLKREQIVLVLPQKNKAFQRPEDFADLKMLRRKLQAELIFVTPAGPGPAEFARQRRFAVFSTVESFVRTFPTGSTSQSDQSSQPNNRSDQKGLFGRAKVAQGLPTPLRPTPLPPQTPRPQIEDGDVALKPVGIKAQSSTALAPRVEFDAADIRADINARQLMEPEGGERQ
jgi:hypothetical protein